MLFFYVNLATLAKGQVYPQEHFPHLDAFQMKNFIETLLKNRSQLTYWAGGEHKQMSFSETCMLVSFTLDQHAPINHAYMSLLMFERVRLRLVWR